MPAEKTNIDREQLILLQELARLQTDPERAEEFRLELARMLELIDHLRQTDTEGVEPLTNPCDDIQRLRTDEVTEEDQRELFLRNAPLSEAGLYLVPKVVEK